jgi:hypothetical protein
MCQLFVPKGCWLIAFKILAIEGSANINILCFALQIPSETLVMLEEW